MMRFYALNLDLISDKTKKKNESQVLLNKEKILAISKSDMLDLELKKEIKKDLPKNISTLFISSVAQSGIRELKDLIWNKLNE